MKSLVVLSALVSLAIAAPALPGGGFQVTNRSPNWHIQTQSSLADFLRRERKSPSETATSSILNPVSNTEVQNVQHIDAGAPTQMARSFALKKPLIVKKKNGYRLYRDSEEEKANADSQESCGRQVKVKLCDEDGKFKKPMMGSPHGTADLHTSEDDVKQSIRMAKEAVENLQRDLKKMEQKPDMKMALDSEADTELHEDIEVARQALEHIHENFGNLEPSSLHATASRDSEPMQDVKPTIAKTEEERLAQWKEAIENIQKNFEVVKNIEDSFKADQSESAAIKNDQNVNENVKSNEPFNEVNHVRADENATQERNTEEDMKSAASEMIETHLDNVKNQVPLVSESHKIHEPEKRADETLEDLHNDNIHHQTQEKGSEMNMLTEPSEHPMSQVPFMKSKDDAFKTSENIPDAHIIPTNAGKLLNLDSLSEQQRTVAFNGAEDKMGNHQKQGKDAADDMTAPDDMIDFLAKSAEHSNRHEMEKEPIPHDHVMELGKAAETLKPEHIDHLSEDMQAKEAIQNPVFETKKEENFHNIPKTAEQLQMNHLQNLPVQTENTMLAKSADHISILDHQNQHMNVQEDPMHAETMAAMKAAEELHQPEEMHNALWNSDNKHLDHLSTMKAAEQFKKDFEINHGQGLDINPEHIMDHLRHSHIVEHSHELPSHVQPHHHFPQRYHHKQMAHSNLHDMNSMGSHMHGHYHPGMRDASEGFGSDQMMRWKPNQESGRAAYGSGLSSSIGSTGAVGVFPNANTGGCGIPLLLSCSPSVVSGSLAKAHPAVPSSYSAAPTSSYRTEDDFSFHNKRDVKKTNDIRSTNVLRTPIMKQKSQNKM